MHSNANKFVQNKARKVKWIEGLDPHLSKVEVKYTYIMKVNLHLVVAVQYKVCFNAFNNSKKEKSFVSCMKS